VTAGLGQLSTRLHAGFARGGDDKAANRFWIFPRGAGVGMIRPPTTCGWGWGWMRGRDYPEIDDKRVTL